MSWKKVVYKYLLNLYFIVLTTVLVLSSKWGKLFFLDLHRIWSISFALCVWLTHYNLSLLWVTMNFLIKIKILFFIFLLGLFLLIEFSRTKSYNQCEWLFTFQTDTVWADMSYNNNCKYLYIDIEYKPSYITH